MSMRKTLFSIATALLCFTGCTSVPKTCEQPYEPIQIAVPERPAGQQDAVGLTAPKIDTVRVGFIGWACVASVPWSVGPTSRVYKSKRCAICVLTGGKGTKDAGQFRYAGSCDLLRCGRCLETIMQP